MDVDVLLAVSWDAVTAVGTLGAVIVALGVALLPMIVARRRRPRLSVTHSELDIVRSRRESEDVARFRLRISCAQRKVAAAAVEVFVESISETVAEGIRALLPAGGQPLRASHSSRVAQAVPSGASRFVDLVELRRRAGEKTSASILLAEDPVELTIGRTYRLEVSVAGANLDSFVIRCEVVWKSELDPSGFPQEAVWVHATDRD